MYIYETKHLIYIYNIYTILYKKYLLAIFVVSMFGHKLILSNNF